MIDVVTRPVPVEVVTPLRPSEAIRLGCLIAPVQAFGQMGFGQQACALGAMVAGYSGFSALSYDFKFSQPATEVVDDLPKNVCPIPRCSDGPDDVVIHLNDDHRWSREQIADWLEGLGL